MTEEDTFKKLKQLPYEKMVRIYVDYINSGHVDDSGKDINELFSQYGWDRIEFQRILWSKKLKHFQETGDFS